MFCCRFNEGRIRWQPPWFPHYFLCAVPRWPWRCWRTATIVSSPVLRCLERWTATCAKPWPWRARRPTLPWWAVPIRVCHWKPFSMPCPVTSLCWGMPGTLVSGIGSLQVSLFDFFCLYFPWVWLALIFWFVCSRFGPVSKMRYSCWRLDPGELGILHRGSENSADLCVGPHQLRSSQGSHCGLSFAREASQPRVGRLAERAGLRGVWGQESVWQEGHHRWDRQQGRGGCGAQQLESVEPNRLNYLAMFCIWSDHLSSVFSSHFWVVPVFLLTRNLVNRWRQWSWTSSTLWISCWSTAMPSARRCAVVTWRSRAASTTWTQGRRRGSICFGPLGGTLRQLGLSQTLSVSILIRGTAFRSFWLVNELLLRSLLGTVGTLGRWSSWEKVHKSPSWSRAVAVWRPLWSTRLVAPRQPKAT